MGRLNPFHETKFSGANADSEINNVLTFLSLTVV